MALALGCLIEKWPWPWGACWGRCLEGLEGLGGFWRVCGLKGVEGLEGFGGFGGFGGFWRVFGVWRILERLEGFGGFGVFAGWQTAALKAHRKPLLWPWPWGACSGSGLGPGVPAGDGVWRVWKVLEEGFGIWSVCRLANGSFESP